MASPQVNVAVVGGSSGLRQRLQELVDANRIAMNLRQQSQLTAVKAALSIRGQA